MSSEEPPENGKLPMDVTIITNAPKELAPDDRCTWQYGTCGKKGYHVFNDHWLCNEHFMEMLKNYIFTKFHE